MNMKLEVLPAREAIARHGGVVHVAVRATPEAVATRQPVVLAIVVDSSGSMGEPAGRPGEGRGAPSKMRFVKDAAHHLVDLLEDGDGLSVIAFEDTARTVLRPMKLDSGSRADVHSAIEALRPGGMTNLAAGLDLGLLGLLSARHGRLVLLSDGETNVGETRIEALGDRAREAAAHGVTVSALGVGFEYNIDLLRVLSDAGGGDFHHVEDPRSIEQALTHELLGAAAVAARGVEIELRVPNPATLGGANLNGYPETSVDGGAVVRVGDLARARDVVFEIVTPVAFSGHALKVEAVARGTDADGSAFEAAAATSLRVVAAADVEAAGLDPDVVQLVLRLLKARAETEFAARVDQGDAASAKLAFGRARRSISAASAAYGGPPSAPAMLAELDELEATLDSGDFNRMASKALFMRGHAAQRSRGPEPDAAVPFDRAYWVDAPRLLAGCYPGDLDPAVAAQKMRGLADAGVRTIVNLMVPGETSHGGRAFRPYEDEAIRLGIEVMSHPITDQGVADQATLTGILDTIDGSIAAGRAVYVHCWGGRGRTGMVVGCWLVRHGVVAPSGAVAKVRALRRDCPDANLPSPENRAQVQVVKHWVRGL